MRMRLAPLRVPYIAAVSLKTQKKMYRLLYWLCFLALANIRTSKIYIDNLVNFLSIEWCTVNARGLEILLFSELVSTAVHLYVWTANSY